MPKDLIQYKDDKWETLSDELELAKRQYKVRKLYQLSLLPEEKAKSSFRSNRLDHKKSPELSGLFR